MWHKIYQFLMPNNKSKKKRVLSGLLAFILLAVPILTNIYRADSNQKKVANNGWVFNLPESNSIFAFGSNRHSMRYWLIDGKPAYCINPGKTMNTGTVMGSSEDAYEGMDEQQRIRIYYTLYYGNADAVVGKGTYAGTQSLIWAIVSGQWEESEIIATRDTMADYLNRNGYSSIVNDFMKTYTDIYHKIKILESNIVPSFAGNTNYNAPTYSMKDEDGDGIYEITLTDEYGQLGSNWDISSVPEGVTYTVSGQSITFRSSASSISGTIKLSPRAGSPLADQGPVNAGSVIFWTPDPTSVSEQAMVTVGVDAADPFQAFFNLNKSGYSINSIEDTFEASYTVKVNKRDSETRMGLQGVKFGVYEDGDLIGTMTTNRDGKASYTTIKSEDFSATYCNGHEEVEEGSSEETLHLFDLIDYDGKEPHRYSGIIEDDTNEAVATPSDAVSNSKNAKLGEATDSNAVYNTDAITPKKSNSSRNAEEGEEGEETEECTADYHSYEEAEAARQQAEDEFMERVYTYTIKELTPRYGYVGHGIHPDDSPIGSADLTGNMSHTYGLSNHRTTGEIRINKRDKELFEEDPDNSEGATQGDGKLEGATYGLYAAEDITHPDGHTGVVYHVNELTTVATTNENGDAIFQYYSEGLWAGKPLLLGKYYIKELSRSEGYELSVGGKNLPDSNRDGSSKDIELKNNGRVTSTNFFYSLDEYSGNELFFTTNAVDTTEGYVGTLKNIPSGSKLYQITYTKETKTENKIVGRELVDQTDSEGNIVYQMATGEEYKLDEAGNRIPVTIDGEIQYDLTSPAYDSFKYVKKSALYPNGSPEAPADPATWNSTSIDASYVETEATRMLEEIGYQNLGDDSGAPWAVLPLVGISTNGDAVNEIITLFEAGSGTTKFNSFYIDDVYYDSGAATWYVKFHRAVIGDDTCIYDVDNNQIIIKKVMIVDLGGGLTYPSFYYITYNAPDFQISGSKVTVKRMALFGKDGVQTVDASQPIPDPLPVYNILYEKYAAGDFILDREGNKIPVKVWKDVYADVTWDEVTEVRTEIPMTYQDGVYSFRRPEPVNGTLEEQFVVTVPLNGYNGSTPYLDYLVDNGATVSVNTPNREVEEKDPGSYVVYVTLDYPGKTVIVETAGTDLNPLIVLQRAIKQPIKITKTISKESYENNYHGIPEVTKLKGFKFKLYLIKDIENTGLLTQDKYGQPDYRKFFDENTELGNSLSMEADEPRYDLDQDLTTIHCSYNAQSDHWYGTTIPLPYGIYLLVEQQPDVMPNNQYKIAAPEVIKIPFIPQVGEDKQTPSDKYIFDASKSIEEIEKEYLIRFGTEAESPQVNDYSHVINSKYGDGESAERISAADGKFENALIPWSLVAPGVYKTEDGQTSYREENYDDFVGWIYRDVENTFYKSKLRIEKIDSETKENILHDGAYFKIYKASRDQDGKIIWNNGVPAYKESDVITQYDETGHEVGIFKAFTTIRDVSTPEGVKQETVGYIETYQPLGAGAYVLVELEAPEGYVKSDPIGIEIYSDKTSYYPEGPGSEIVADRYEYAVELEDPDTEDVHGITVENKPSHIAIHKVEDGIEVIQYFVYGSKELLEARNDVKNIEYDAESGEYRGEVEHLYESWSEHLIAGTLEELKAMENVKPLFDAAGKFTGFGIRFDVYVKDAVLTIYQGLTLKPNSNGYDGVTVTRDGTGKVTSIMATETGTHLEINKVGKTGVRDLYDSEAIKNKPASLLFYDIEAESTELDEETGDLYLLDDRGNRIHYLDPDNGLAYVKDDFDNIIAYPTENGEKIVNQSIDMLTDENGNEKMYSNVSTADDENSLPIYYQSWNLDKSEDIWTTGTKKHQITRLPFGAYVLEETKVPHQDGYIQSKYIGFVLNETSEEQEFFLEDDFTKIEVAKVDITTLKEIQDAHMTLYNAVRVEDESEKGYHLEIMVDGSGNRSIYSEWISGYQYNAAGNMVNGSDGKPIKTTIPHWLDHVPIGYYILEESVVPHAAGYVQSEPMEIIVEEVGIVQTYTMLDDYTKLEVRKYDTKTEDIVLGAKLGVWKAVLGENGEPSLDENGWPIKGEFVFLFDIDQTVPEQLKDEEGNLLYDPVTNKPIMDYSPFYKEIDTTVQGRYFSDENGITHIEYLPIGYYVLTEEYTPDGYATAYPQIMHCREVGGTIEIQRNEMGNQPLRIDISKRNITGGDEILGAKMAVYEVGEDNKPYLLEDGSYDPKYKVDSWISGQDGVYLEGEEIPEGSSVGDLKPHTIEYIKVGDYVLVEEITPYGFLMATEIYFTIIDTHDIQLQEMIDEIPIGKVEILKTDSEDPEMLLSGAKFEITNKTLDVLVDTLITDDSGKATSIELPAGYLGENGKYVAYTYQILETEAPEDYMINPIAHEFQFEYLDDQTKYLTYAYTPTDIANQAKISKQMITGEEELPGAKLKVEKVAEDGSLELIEEWISTEQPHYVNRLKKGQYILTEIMPPGPGFGIATAIEFEITDNMTEPVYVVMKDEHTTTIIEKVSNQQKDKMLPGAKLRVEDLNGNIRDEWITTEETHVIKGLEPGFYWLIEVEPPVGYTKAAPYKFEVGTEFKEYTVQLVNRKITTGGGGKTVTPGKPKDPDPKVYVYLNKVDPEGKPLQGAVFALYGENGQEIARETTDSNGQVTFLVDPGYFHYKEISAPNGFSLNLTKNYITVLANGTVNGDLTIKNDYAKISISKLDSETLEALSGAEFTLYTIDGEEVAKAISDESGLAVFDKVQRGDYYMMETDAPEGYILSPEKRFITINRFYTNAAPIVWENDYDPTWRISTGDQAPLILLGVAGIGTLAGALVLQRKRKREDE